MTQNSATQSDFDQTLNWIDSLMSTPHNIDQLVSYGYETPVQLGGDCLDDLLEVFQHFTPSCSSTSGTTTAFYDDSLLSKTSEKYPSSPQLDIDLLDEFVLRELESISAELSDYNSTRRGQKVKKRLFSCSSDEEPTPKKRRVSSSSDSESDDDLQFAWTSARRS